MIDRANKCAAGQRSVLFQCPLKAVDAFAAIENAVAGVALALLLAAAAKAAGRLTGSLRPPQPAHNGVATVLDRAGQPIFVGCALAVFPEAIWLWVRSVDDSGGCGWLG